jgi:hypothetical protein
LVTSKRPPTEIRTDHGNQVMPNNFSCMNAQLWYKLHVFMNSRYADAEINFIINNSHKNIIKDWETVSSSTS